MRRVDGTALYILVETERCGGTVGGLLSRLSLMWLSWVSVATILRMAQESIDVISLNNRPDERHTT
jgi:hypothetical protein